MKVPAEERFPRFTLDDNEQVCWIATYVAAGRGQEIGLVAGQPQSWFLAFARNLKGDAAESISNIFSVLQHVLMAQRKTDFLTTQLEPAFSGFTRANAVALAKAAQGGELAFMAAWNGIFSAGWEERIPEQILVSCTWWSGRLSSHCGDDPGSRPGPRHPCGVLVFVSPLRPRLESGPGAAKHSGRGWAGLRPT